MTTQTKRNRLAATFGAIALGAALAAPASVLADEFGSNTPYYEDDAWYDVSEWFDGNDYNPTDEAIGRWDNETFSFADNVNSSDNDNFLNWGDYGYRDQSASDGFYDYYDDGYGQWDDKYYSSYYDTDDDGVYDAYASYEDTDGDGTYEDFEYYAFDSQTRGQDEARRQAESMQKQMRSTAMKVSGKVQSTKMVNVRDRVHLIATVDQSSGNSMAVDLGPNQTITQLFQGDQLTAEGHVLNIGNKPVLVAKNATMANGSIEIDRNGKKYQGTVEMKKTVSVRGTDHQLVKVKTTNNKTMMVDMGPTSNLDASLDEGAQVTVQGVPVKVKDRVILMARQVMTDGTKIKIQRETASSR